jgi:hypothetical protein
MKPNPEVDEIARRGMEDPDSLTLREIRRLGSRVLLLRKEELRILRLQGGEALEPAAGAAQ